MAEQKLVDRTYTVPDWSRGHREPSTPRTFAPMGMLFCESSVSPYERARDDASI